MKIVQGTSRFVVEIRQGYSIPRVVREWTVESAVFQKFENSSFKLFRP